MGGGLLDVLRHEAMSATYRPVATACYWGALRVSEALSLRWSDVRGDDLLVRGTKTKGSTATIPLLPPLKAALDAHRKERMALGLHLVSDDALVFGTADGGPLSRRNVLRAINDAGDTAGLNPEGVERVGCHDLRHSAASRALVDLGMSLPEVATFLRHSNSNVTGSTYAGISDAAREGIREKLAVGLWIGPTESAPTHVLRRRPEYQARSAYGRSSCFWATPGLHRTGKWAESARRRSERMSLSMPLAGRSGPSRRPCSCPPD